MMLDVVLFVSADVEVVGDVVSLCDAEGMWNKERCVASGPAYRLEGGG